MAAQSETISLNLILDYPVKWSKYKVLRDFIQNFYDAVGYQNWHRDFNYQVEGQTLQLTARNIGFSYDWLIHIGASTKRENEGAFAGYGITKFLLSGESFAREKNLGITSDCYILPFPISSTCPFSYYL